MVYILPFEDSDLDSTIRCISYTFVQETISQSLEIDAENYREFAKLYCQIILGNKLSLVVRNEEFGDVIGFSILTDFVTEIPDFTCLDPRLIVIINFTRELDDWYKSKYKVKSGEILHLSMTGVYEQYRGRGIAQKLMEETFNVAKTNNYKSIIAECTGEITQHIRAKYGFKIVKEIVYKTYLYNGELVFKDIQKPPSCKLMIKTID